jgi:hypothetical protein
MKIPVLNYPSRCTAMQSMCFVQAFGQGSCHVSLHPRLELVAWQVVYPRISPFHPLDYCIILFPIFHSYLGGTLAMFRHAQIVSGVSSYIPLNGPLQFVHEQLHEESYALVGGLDHFLFFHILGIIAPTDCHVFQRGRSTTSQSIYLPWSTQFNHMINPVLRDGYTTNAVGNFMRATGFEDLRIPLYRDLGGWDDHRSRDLPKITTVLYNGYIATCEL